MKVTILTENQAKRIVKEEIKKEISLIYKELDNLRRRIELLNDEVNLK